MWYYNWMTWIVIFIVKALNTPSTFDTFHCILWMYWSPWHEWTWGQGNKARVKAERRQNKRNGIKSVGCDDWHSRESQNIKTVQTSCLTPVTDDTRPIRAQSSHRPMPAPHDTRRPERELAKTWASCPERWGQTKRLFPPEPDHEDTTFSWRKISSPWPMWRPQNTEGLNLYSVLLFYQLMFMTVKNPNYLISWTSWIRFMAL